MKRKDIIKYSTICILLLLLIYFIMWKLYRVYFEFDSWISMIMTSLVTIITSIATIVAVLISIHYTNKNEKKDECYKLRRLKMIVFFELNEYIERAEEIFYSYLENCWNEGLHSNLDREKEIKPKYILGEDIKNAIYEIILLDLKNQKTRDLYKIYKMYCIDHDNKGINPWLSVMFSSEYNEICKKLKRQLVYHLDEDFGEEYEEDLLLSYGQVKDLKEILHKKERLNLNPITKEVMEYLKEGFLNG